MRAVLFTLLVLSSPVVAADEDKEYYPTKVGTKWTYKIRDQELVITAASSEKIGTQECVKFEAKIKDQLIGSEHNAILKDGIYRFKYSDDAIEPAICFFKASAKKGEPWTQAFKVGEVQATGKYEMDTEDVAVPAGKFKEARVVRAEAIEKLEGKPVVTKTTMWFAKNVGMVKQVINTDDKMILIELLKMEEAAK